MGSELKALRLKTGATTADMISVLQKTFPGYDKTMQSKCENPEKYGVTLQREAMGKLYEAFDPERRTDRKRDRHLLPCRITARLPADVYTALQQTVTAQGYASTQEWLAEQVAEYLHLHGAENGKEQM